MSKNLKKEFRSFHRGNNKFNMTTFDAIISKYEMYQNPTIIEERKLNVAAMDVFSRLMMERIIFFGSEVTSETSNIVMSQLLFLENQDPSRDITLYVNSPGGDVYSGMGVIDTMNLISPDVATVNVALAASMGAMILMSGEKGKRSALKHSRTMIHQPLSGTRGQASDIEITANQIKNLKRELYEHIVECSEKKTYEEIERDADRDYWMTSDEALDYGLIDFIVGKK